MNQRVLHLEGTVNLRDLGGYVGRDGRQVKWGRLYRSGRLDKLAGSACERLRARQIRTVVDLRFPDEHTQFPTVVDAFDGARFIVWQSPEKGGDGHHSMDRFRSLFQAADAEGMRNIMRERYPRFLKSHRKVYAQMLDALAAGDTPLLFHCSAGKDRTGVAAALILSVLGVPKDVVLQDYALTQQELGEKLENWVAGGIAPGAHYTELLGMMGDMPPELLQPLFDAHESYLESLFTHVDREFGDFESYAINQLNQTHEKLDRMRDALLENQPATAEAGRTS